MVGEGEVGLEDTLIHFQNLDLLLLGKFGTGAGGSQAGGVVAGGLR